MCCDEVISMAGRFSWLCLQVHLCWECESGNGQRINQSVSFLFRKTACIWVRLPCSAMRLSAVTGCSRNLSRRKFVVMHKREETTCLLGWAENSEAIVLAVGNAWQYVFTVYSSLLNNITCINTRWTVDFNTATVNSGHLLYHKWLVCSAAMYSTCINCIPVCLTTLYL